MNDVPYKRQLELTDDQFLDHLKLPGSAGKALAKARALNDAAQIRAVVAEHFRTRSAPQCFYYMHGSPWHENDAPGSVIEKADGLLNDRYRNSWPPHQWIGIGGKDGTNNWEQAITEAGSATSRTTFVTELSTAFSLTGNPEYARKVLALLHSFVKAFPFNLDPKFEEDHDGYFGGQGNNTLSVCYRVFRWTDLLYSGVIHAPGIFSDEDVFWLIKQLWFYAMQYYRLCGDAMRRDNHHLVDHGHSQFFYGIMFPEFDISAEMTDYGAKVIRHHAGANLLKDGGYAEHSAEYQYHIAYHFLHPLGIAAANDYKLLNSAQIENVQKWVEFNARLALPNGRIPPFGDSDGRTYHHFFGQLGTAVMTPKLAAMARALSIEPGVLNIGSAPKIAKRMSDWREGEPAKIGLSNYFLNKGQTKKPDAKNLPPTASANFPQGGYTIFRTEWSSDADYLAMSHHSKELNGGHAHLDMLSFVLHTKGKLLIGDPATWLYFDRRFFGHGGGKLKPGTENAGWHRGYSYGANSHNVFVRNYDFLRPLRALNHFTVFGLQRPPLCGLGMFEAGGPIEVSEAWHDENAPLRHRRLLVHIKGIGFAFVEMMNSPVGSLAPYDYSQFYHFEYDVDIAPAEPQVQQTLKAFSGDAECYIVPGREAEVRWQCGRDEYLKELYSLYRKPDGPEPWIAELTRQTRGPVVFTNFIITGGADGFGRAPEARYLGAKPSPWMTWQSDGHSAHALDLGRNGTLLLASCPYGKPLVSDDLETDAELAVVLLDANGKLKSWALARGSKLTVRGKKLLSGRKVEWKAS
jgi:hypothetical protein